MIERGTEGVQERVAQLAALIERARASPARNGWALRREGELAEQRAHAFLILRH